MMDDIWSTCYGVSGYHCEAEIDGPSRNLTPCAFQLRFRMRLCLKMGYTPNYRYFSWGKWWLTDGFRDFRGAPFQPHVLVRGSAGGTKDYGSPLASAEPQGQEMWTECRGKETVSLKKNWHWQPNMASWEIPCKWLYYIVLLYVFFGKPST